MKQLQPIIYIAGDLTIIGECQNAAVNHSQIIAGRDIQAKDDLLKLLLNEVISLRAELKQLTKTASQQNSKTVKQYRGK